ncbi:MAG: MFS transporter [Enterocloster sp.]
MNHWKKNFFIIWTGQAFSQLSSSVLQFAIVWYLTDRTGSALILAAAMLMGFLPQGLLGPWIGVFIDRCQRKRIMIWSDLLISAAGMVMVLADRSGLLSAGLILGVLFLRSVGTAFHSPCLQAVTPQIVPEDQLTRCAGYSQTLQSVSNIFSPVLAAVLYQNWSMGGIILLDVLGALIAVSALAVSHIPALQQSDEQKEFHMLREAAEGFRILKTKKGVMGLVLVSALYTLALMPTSALFPLMSMSYFGGTSVQASIAEVSFSAGLLAGSLILSLWGGTKNRVHMIIFSYLIMSLCLFVSGSLPPDGFFFFAVCSAVMGISGPFYWGMYRPILQSSFEDRYLGRIMSLAGSIQVMTAPAGLAFSGVFAERFGVEKWFILAGALTLAAAFICLLTPSIRKCDSGKKSGAGY